MNTLQLAHATPTYWLTILVAALISAAVSIVGYWQNARAKRQDRQRQLFADAYRAVMEYREFAYKVRRRPAGTDRNAITDALSDVQAQLNLHMATLEIEAPRVAVHYRKLVAETKRVVGPQIAAGWDSQPIQNDTDIHNRDVDLSGLASFDRDFIRAAKSRLSLRWQRSKLDCTPAMISDSCESSISPHTATVTTENHDPEDSSIFPATAQDAPDEPILDPADGIPRIKRLLLIIIGTTLMTYAGYMLIAFSIDLAKNIDEYIAALLAIVFWVSVASTIRVVFKSTERSFECLARISERLFRS